MTPRVRRYLATCISLLLLWTVTACSAPKASDPGSGPAPADNKEPAKAAKNTLKFGTYTAPSNDLDPRRAAGGLWQAILMAYTPLMYRDHNLNLVPGLAEKWSWKDETTLVFNLRRDAKWPDGKPVTARDVEYTLQTVIDPKFGAPNRNNYTIIKEIVVQDDFNLEIRLSAPYSPFLTYLSGMYLAIVSKEYDQANPGALRTKPWGSGPYQVAEFAPAEKMVLTAKNDWWGSPKPTITRVEWLGMPDDSARLLALETGSVDIIDRIPIQDIKRMQDSGKFTVIEAAPSGTEFVGITSQNKPFDDLRVRKALAMAVNRDEIIQHVFQGRAQAAYGPIIPASFAFNPNLKSINAFDVAAAKKLLAEAGYPNGFKTTLQMTGRWQEPQYAQILQQQWKQIGVEVEIVQKEYGAHMDDLLNGRVKGLFLMAWLSYWDPDQHFYRQFHSKNWSPNGFNWGHYKNDEVDKLLDLARTSPDQAVRKQHYMRLQEIVATELPYIWLHMVPEYVAHHKDLQGMELGASYAGLDLSIMKGSWK